MFPDASGKRYHTFDAYLKKTLGFKCAKAPLDAGFSCPNRDGVLSSSGCLFCGGGGAENPSCSAPGGSKLDPCLPRAVLPLRVQYEKSREATAAKWGPIPSIAAFSSFSSTYAPARVLRRLFYEVLGFPAVAGLSVGTRPDLLPPDVLSLFEELSARTFLTVELGLESALDRTLALMRRGHTFGDFVSGFTALKSRGIRVCVHLINGLPGETREEMLYTVRALSSLRPDGVKFHELYIRSDAPLSREYQNGGVTLLTREEYVHVLADQIALLPPETVVERVTGDPQKDGFLAPLWARDKKKTVALLDRTLAARGIFQGCAFDPELQIGSFLRKTDG